MEGLFPNVGADANWSQVLVMTGLYAKVLFVAANMIGDGAELLLLCPPLAPLVGSIVLPILGAIPDGLMVLFSGLGERSEAISQVSVGMGAMAGSSVMLLTMPWFLAVLAGRVSIVNGEPTYVKPANAEPNWAKLSPPNSMSLVSTGVAIGDAIQSNAKLMILTCTTYACIQVPSWFIDDNSAAGATKGMPADGSIPQWFEDQARDERVWAWVSLAACVIWFVYYLIKMKQQGFDDKVVTASVEGIQNGHITIWGALHTELMHKGSTGLAGKLLNSLYGHGASDFHAQIAMKEEKARLRQILRPFFKQYDSDNSGTVSRDEFVVIVRDLRLKASRREQAKIFKTADEDGTGTIDFEEFVQCVMNMMLDGTLADCAPPPAPPQKNDAGKGKKNDDDDDEDGEDELPEDLAALSPEEQQKRIKQRAFTQMGLGTILVVIFSDPMCDMLGIIGEKLDVPKFFVAFLLAPLASNASELIAAMKLASKKTAKSMVDSLSSLEGAAVMNNTFCMAIFLFLILYQNLAFTYKAETVSIVVVELLIGGLALKSKTMRFLDACIVLACYPACLFLVVFLESCGLD
jgi:Ca2+/Na+ antiporter